METSTSEWHSGIRENEDTFSLGIKVDTLTFQNLHQAEDAYLFKIRGNICDIDQAEKLVGPKFQREQVDAIAEYTGTEATPKDKKKVYLVTMKS